MSTFSPPFFGKFGKSFGDLFKKNYGTSNTVEIVNKTDFGLKVTTKGEIGAKDIQATSSAEYSDKNAKYEGEVDTANGKVWGTVTLTSLLKEVDVSISGGFDPKSRDALVKGNGGVKVEGKYKKDFLVASARVVAGTKTKKDKSLAEDPTGRLEADAAIGFDGISVGASISASILDPEAKDDMNINVACQYQQSNFTASLATEKMSDVIKVSWFHKMSPDLSVGAQLVSDEFGRLTKKGQPQRRRTLNVATQYRLNKDCIIKARSNNYGEVAVGVQQTLKDPRVKVNAGATFTAKGTSSFAADKFGLGLTFGDF